MAGVRAVVDTNVIVSAVISDKGWPRRLLESLAASKFTLVTCPGQIAEVSRALRYDRIRLRYRLSEDDLRAVSTLLWTQTELVADLLDAPEIVGDPGDDLLVHLCETAKVDYFVTGNRELLSLVSRSKTQVLSVRAFAELFD